MTGRYGEGPVSLCPYRLDNDWHEFMHYLYLPVVIPEERGEVRLPKRLAFLFPAVIEAMADASREAEHLRSLDTLHVYVTARRGFAGPGNPLNRPGWHCDDFGGSDLNYIWSDVFPTRFLLSDEALLISADDKQSMQDMADLASVAGRGGYHWRVEDGPVNELLRLTPWVIHNTPEIPAPGGMRSFFKISVSTHRYDLLGNSHNHLLDYDWPMVDRSVLRNQPGGNRDYSGATA